MWYAAYSRMIDERRVHVPKVRDCRGVMPAGGALDIADAGGWLEDLEDRRDRAE